MSGTGGGYNMSDGGRPESVERAVSDFPRRESAKDRYSVSGDVRMHRQADSPRSVDSPTMYDFITAALRVLIAVMIIIAIALQLKKSVKYWNDEDFGRRGMLVVNFFSYMTIETNIFGVVVFLTGAVLLLAFPKQRLEPRWYAIMRVCNAVYLFIVGVVANLLLRSGDQDSPTFVRYSNEVLHVVSPVLAVLDFVLAPKKRRLRWKYLPIVLIYPIIYIMYTLIRGPHAADFTNNTDYWYPYPFLNPHKQPKGYATVSLYIIAIAAVTIGIAAAAHWYSRRFLISPLDRETSIADPPPSLTNSNGRPSSQLSNSRDSSHNNKDSAPTLENNYATLERQPTPRGGLLSDADSSRAAPHDGTGANPEAVRAEGARSPTEV